VQVIGQTQDLFDLQRILKRSETKLGNQAQQNMTRLGSAANELLQTESLSSVYNRPGV
jgi:hypothetical protein